MEIFTEGFVSEDQQGLATLSILSNEDSRSMSERLRSQGFIKTDDVVHSVAKYYSYSEYFNLLVFGGSQW